MKGAVWRRGPDTCRQRGCLVLCHLAGICRSIGYLRAVFAAAPTLLCLHGITDASSYTIIPMQNKNQTIRPASISIQTNYFYLSCHL